MDRRKFSKVSVLGLAVTALKRPTDLATKALVAARDDVQSNTSILAWFQDARFGMFITFGLSTLLGEEVLAQELDGIPAEEYATLREKFNPTEFSAGDWIQIAKDAGQKYVLITAKNHDGFALWDTKASDFSVTQSPFGRDLCKELAEECHREKIPLFFYFSLMDWHSPLYRPCQEKGTPVSQEFLDFMRSQIRELCMNYGKIGGMWFDGDWDHTPGQWEADKLVSMIRELQPDALINNRLGRYNPDHVSAWDPDRMGDFSCPEMSLRDIPAESGRAWEFNSTINDSWAYSKADTRFKRSDRLVQLLVISVAHGGNYLLDIAPLPSGKMLPESVTRIRKVGEWLKRNGESIYGAGSFRRQYFDNCFSTKKGNKVYLHLFDWAPGAGCDLWTLGLKDAEHAYFLETGTPVEFTRSHGRFGLRLRARNTNSEPSPDTVIVFDGATPL